MYTSGLRNSSLTISVISENPAASRRPLGHNYIPVASPEDRGAQIISVGGGKGGCGGGGGSFIRDGSGRWETGQSGFVIEVRNTTQKSISSTYIIDQPKRVSLGEEIFDYAREKKIVISDRSKNTRYKKSYSLINQKYLI